MDARENAGPKENAKGSREKKAVNATTTVSIRAGKMRALPVREGVSTSKLTF